MQKISIIYSKVTALLILLVCGMSEAFLVSCAADDNEFTRNVYCRFTFDTKIHNASYLLNCINPMSTGMFCMVWQESYGGVRIIQVQLNDGKTSDNNGKGNAITDKIEAKQPCTLGYGNNGLIIGCSSYNAQLYAFDRTCPNCYDSGQSRKLQWDNSGNWVKCNTCQRSYDLNNFGFVAKGESGRKLMRYLSTYTGAALIVNN